ncbi:MAG: NYN domain-containing protein [Thermoleophilia bacterium]
MSKRVCFIVAGFNVYHSLKEVEKQQGCRCHWLDLPGLCRSYLPLIGGGAILGSVYYFSALASHVEAYSPGTVARHQIFIEALEAMGVTVGLGRFKAKDLYHTCPACGHHLHLRRHEEKETDVRIAVKLVEVVADGSCDVAAVISGDTDLVPAVAAARRLQPHVDVYMLFPPRRSNLAFDGVATGSFKIAAKQYVKHQLPDLVMTADGRAIHKPAGW